ncbi:MAG TPA: membrane protein insertase YidC [Chthoniobacterales bacterium]
MDRKTWLAVGLSIAGIILFQWYYQTTYGPYLKQQEKLRAEQAAAAQSAAPAPTASATPTGTPVTAAAPVEPTGPVMTARSETLAAKGKKDAADFVFNNDAGGIESVELRMHRSEDQSLVSLNRDRRMPIGALGTDARTAVVGFDMATDRANNVVTFTKREGDGLEIVKKFTLPAGDAPEAPYVANLEITFRNTGTTPLSRPGYFLSAGGAAPIHKHDLPLYTRFDWSHDGKMNGIDIGHFGASGLPWLGIEWRKASDTFSEAVDPVRWAAVASQYFCTIVTALDEPGNSVAAAQFKVPGAPADQPIHGLQGAIGLKPFTIEPGATRTQKFQIYAGPKELSRLQKLGYGQDAVMNFGWFGFVSKFLLWAMNLLHGVLFGSYAAAIVVLTLCIKFALWPLQNKATNSMRRMAALSPKMTEVREKYKDDPTKQNEELMKLYRDYGVNPFSGCLPMLIQIPIFFGFYSMLGSAIELRNSSFFWIRDLSQPDTIGHVLGIPINVLPILMTGSMVWQMAITPKTGDAMQQRMMMFMPIIFLAFAYNYASALSLYWTTQNLFSIVQLYLTRNTPLPVLEKVKTPARKKQDFSTPRTRKKRP